MNAIISNISIEPGKTGIQRFVLTLSVPAEKPTYEFFGTPLDNDPKSIESQRINFAQIRNAIPDLMGVTDIVRHMLLNRSKFVARKVEISVEDQIDKETKRPALNPRTGTAYHNVRLLPSHEDMTEAQVTALLVGHNALPADVTADIQG